MGILEIYVLEELMTMFYLLDDKGVIHKPEPQAGRVGDDLTALT